MSKPKSLVAARPRRSYVECVLCGEPTRAANAVCHKCQSVYDTGKRLGQRFSSDSSDLVAVPLARDLRSPSHLAGRGSAERRAVYGWGNKERDRILRCAVALAGGVIEYLGDVRNVTRGVDILTTPAISGHETAPEIIMIPANRLDALREFVVVLTDLLAATYDDGYSKGDSLLARLAKDDLTVTQLSAIENRNKERHS